MAMIRTTAPTTTATGTTAPSAAALGPSLPIITTPQPTTGPPTPPSRPPPRPPPRSLHHHHHDHRHHHHHHHHGRPSPSTLRCRVSAPPNLLRRILVFGNRSRRTTAVLRRPLPIAPPTSTSVATICLFGDYSSHDCPARMHATPPPFVLYRLLRYRRLPRSNDAPMADPTPTATRLLCFDGRWRSCSHRRTCCDEWSVRLALMGRPLRSDDCFSTISSAPTTAVGPTAAVRRDWSLTAVSTTTPVATNAPV